MMSRFALVSLCWMISFHLGISTEFSFMKNHSVISISGWPQSGTSLVHEFLAHTPGVSTMIDSCQKFNTMKKCVGFNFEGQWILPGQAHKFLSVNTMCTKFGSATDVEKKAILDRWIDAWDPANHYLAEKSPQNMLKIPFLDSVLSDAQKRKYIIVIKHPATLNIAVPKKTSWYSINQYCSNSKRGITPTGRFVDILRPENAMRTMGALMEDAVRGDVQEQVQTVCKDQVPGTTLSWPSAMHVLAEWLENNRAFSKQNVRILRYEDFEGSSHRVCLFLSSFLFGGGGESAHELRLKELVRRTRGKIGKNEYPSSPPLNNSEWAMDDMIKHCNKLFPYPLRVSGKDLKSRKLLDNSRPSGNVSIISNLTVEERRRLRLHLTAGGLHVDKWTFHPQVAEQSCSERLLRFTDVYFNCLDQNSRNRVAEWDEKLRPFGYGLRRGYYYTYSRKASLFDEWDLLGTYGRYIPLLPTS